MYENNVLYKILINFMQSLHRADFHLNYFHIIHNHHFYSNLLIYSS